MMAFSSFPSHPGFRQQSTDLFHGIPDYSPATFPYPRSLPANQPIFGPSTNQAPSFQMPQYDTYHHEASARAASGKPLSQTPHPYGSGPGPLMNQGMQMVQHTGYEGINMDLFIDPTQRNGPVSFGVVKIKNIPYNVTKQEIVHFLGRNPGIIESGSMGCPVHIVMERSTAKTMDCYVEFQTMEAVKEQVRRQQNLVDSGRHPKLGTRHVTVELSTQDSLLDDLFPRAKSIWWKEGYPAIIDNHDPFSAGFKGFFTKEEMVGLVRHAEYPQRSPFSIKCLQRTYECMISTLYKFPWHATSQYTLADRNSLFFTYMNQMQCLVEKVSGNDSVGLDQKLLMDYIFAGMNCAGFGERQKFELVTAAKYWGGGIRMSVLSCFWPFDVVGRKDGVDDQTVKCHLDIIERGYQVLKHDLPLKEHFIVKPSFATTTPFHEPLVLNNTHFQLNQASERLNFATVLSIEMVLMQELLAAGEVQMQQEWSGATSGGQINYQTQLANNLHKLQLQQAVLQNTPKTIAASLVRSDPHNGHGVSRQYLPESNAGPFSPDDPPVASAIRAPLSPPQSPKGSILDPDDAKGTTPSTVTVKSIDPTSKAFQPHRGFSESRAGLGVAGPTMNFSPYQRRGIGSLSLRMPDVSPTSMMHTSRMDFTTPTKAKNRPRVAVANTIHEEDDEDLFRAMGNAHDEKDI